MWDRVKAAAASEAVAQFESTVITGAQNCVLANRTALEQKLDSSKQHAVRVSWDNSCFAARSTAAPGGRFTGHGQITSSLPEVDITADVNVL